MSGGSLPKRTSPIFIERPSLTKAAAVCKRCRSAFMLPDTLNELRRNVLVKQQFSATAGAKTREIALDSPWANHRIDASLSQRSSVNSQHSPRKQTISGQC